MVLVMLMMLMMIVVLVVFVVLVVLVVVVVYGRSLLESSEVGCADVGRRRSLCRLNSTLDVGCRVVGSRLLGQGGH